jgi:hypothetical protein
MRYGNEAIREVLTADGLSDAERITGKSYKDDESTQWLGFMLHVKACDARRQVLSSNGDTTFAMTTEAYISVIERIGFRLVYREKFTGNSCGQTTSESLFVYFRHPAQLLVFDTFHGDRNSGNVYYNWRPRSLDYPHGITSNSSWWLSESAQKSHDERNKRLFSLAYDSDEYRRVNGESRAAFAAEVVSGDAVLIGSHDCREALTFNLSQLAAYGEFVEPWAKKPFLWLLHWHDTNHSDYDHKAINRERLARLPNDVRKALGNWEE